MLPEAERAKGGRGLTSPIHCSELRRRAGTEVADVVRLGSRPFAWARQIHGDRTALRSSWEVSLQIRVQINKVHGQM